MGKLRNGQVTKRFPAVLVLVESCQRNAWHATLMKLALRLGQNEPYDRERKERSYLHGYHIYPYFDIREVADGATVVIKC